MAFRDNIDSGALFRSLPRLSEIVNWARYFNGFPRQYRLWRYLWVSAMSLRSLALSVLFWLLVPCDGQSVEAAAKNSDVGSLVNLFIGTTNGGHVFPGGFSWLSSVHVVITVHRCHTSPWDGQSGVGHWFSGKRASTCRPHEWSTHRMFSKLVMTQTLSLMLLVLVSCMMTAQVVYVFLS